jgi:hypothetical protein
MDTIVQQESTSDDVTKEISFEEILAAANLLSTENDDEDRIATALRALDW